MERHALLIGSQILGLRGTYNDVNAMNALLSQRGFDVRKCIEAAASRAGILDAYLEGTLLGLLAEIPEPRIEADVIALRPEETAVLALLEQRLSTSTVHS